MTNAQQKTPNTNGWTPERRARQAEAIKRWKPWQNSTGPQTAAGKARSAQNAAKPWRHHLPFRVMDRALNAQRRFLQSVERYRRLKKIYGQNELLDSMAAALYIEGLDCTNGLIVALFLAKLCKNLDFSPPLRQIVNANDNR